MKTSPYLVATGALLLLQLLFVVAYVGHEHTIYFWDHAMYYEMAQSAAMAFHNGWGTGFNELQLSLEQNYNQLFTLPSVLTFSWFGDSRLTFILTNFFCFFLTYEISAAFVLRQVFTLNWATALCASLVTAALIPPLWLPLLEGYPDNGGAALITFAIALALGQSRSWRTAIGLGLLLSASILLRRHFAYPALALLGTMGLFNLITLWQLPKKERLTFFRKMFLFFATCGVALLGSLYLIAPDFTERMLGIDYTELYQSYKKPAFTFIAFAVSGLGACLLLAALAGGWISARQDKKLAQKLVFIGVLGLVWLVIWCAGSSMAGHHYILHIIPLLVSVGLVGLWAGLEKFTARAKEIGIAVSLLLALNSAYALWFSGNGVQPNSNGMAGLFSAPRPPVMRDDYDELVRLAKHLGDTTNNEDRIFIVGSSFVLNQDLMRRVFTHVLHDYNPAMRFIFGPEIDGEQKPPLDTFASATVYVVPTPAQYHLDPAGQTVVTASAKQFPPSASHAGLFKMDTESFKLTDNVTINIWRREGWTPALLRSTLTSIRTIAPGSQQDWVMIEAPRGQVIRTEDEDDGYTSAMAVLDDARPGFEMFFDMPVPGGSYRLGMDVVSHCQNPQFTLTTTNADGKVLWQKQFAPAVTPGSVFQEFSTPKGVESFVRLAAEAIPASHSTCNLVLQNLRIEEP